MLICHYLTVKFFNTNSLYKTIVKLTPDDCKVTIKLRSSDTSVNSLDRSGLCHTEEKKSFESNENLFSQIWNSFLYSFVRVNSNENYSFQSNMALRDGETNFHWIQTIFFFTL